jgi:hypothetical protein
MLCDAVESAVLEPRHIIEVRVILNKRGSVSGWGCTNGVCVVVGQSVVWWWRGMGCVKMVTWSLCLTITASVSASFSSKNLTIGSRLCYKSVTRLLQECYKSVIRVLQECYRGVTRVPVLM